MPLSLLLASEFVTFACNPGTCWLWQRIDADAHDLYATHQENYENDTRQQEGSAPANDAPRPVMQCWDPTVLLGEHGLYEQIQFLVGCCHVPACMQCKGALIMPAICARFPAVA